MAEAFEIKLLSRSQISFDLMTAYFKELGVSIDTIQTIDDWEFSNEKNIELDKVEDELNKNKIVIIDGKLLNNYCGVLIYKEDINYHYGFWISTNNVRSLAKEFIDNSNSEYYNSILKAILNNVNENDIIYCAIGVETDIYNSKTLHHIVGNSLNVVCWIIHKQEKIKLIHYKEDQINNLKIYAVSDIAWIKPQILEPVFLKD